MASEGQSEDTQQPSEPPAAPVQSTRAWQWGAILSAVKDQLPSLDSDASTSDCESDGELFIFQREQPNLIPDLSEELMELSLEDSSMQQTQKTGRHPWEMWNGDLESFGFQKTDDAPVVAKDDVQMIKDETSNLAGPTEEIPSQKEDSRVLEEKELGREQTRERGNSWLNTTWSVEELGDPKERRKLIETKILSKIILEPSPSHPELAVKPPSHGISNSLEKIAKEETSSDVPEMTHLSLQHISEGLMILGEKPQQQYMKQLDRCVAQRDTKIEKWDPDEILEDTEQRKDNIHAEVAFFSADYETFRRRSENELMEKLEELCARQSRTVSPCCRRPSAKLSSCQEQQENKDVALLSSLRSSPRTDTMGFQCLLEPVTVYIDLRNAKPQKSVTFHDEDQSASDSSDEEKETMTIKDKAERTKMNCSGKSLLLQQLHTAQKEASELLCKMPTLPEKLEGIKQDPGSLEEIGSPKINQSKSFKVREEINKVIPRKLARLKPEKRETPFSSCGDNGVDIEKENKMEDEKIQNAGKAPESPLTATELPRTEESKNELSQKEEQMKERHRRHSFQEQLERLQPQQSVTGKQPMAEKTPVLFHMLSQTLYSASLGSTSINENQVWEEHFQSSVGDLGDAELTTSDAEVSLERADIQWYFQGTQVPSFPGKQWIYSENLACQEVQPCCALPTLLLGTQPSADALTSSMEELTNSSSYFPSERVSMQEASYLPDIDTLPGSHSMKNEVLLMTVCLSSCGQVATDQCGEQVSDVVLRAANIYQALVTWLLSLMPPMERKDDPKAPFQVVGLQQAWRESGLALYACLMPADVSSAQKSTKIQEIKTKEDRRGASTFYKKISAFLACTWLPDVIWWRAELINCFQNQQCPLLPEIPSVLLSYVTAVNPDPQAVEKVFMVPAGLYWQTVETDEECFPNCSTIETCGDTDTEVAMVLLFETLLQSPLATHHMLQLVLVSGLDICGLRLLYPQQDVLLSSSEKLPSSYTSKTGKVPPVLALGVRGPKARSTLQNIIGPSDPRLASVTDCGSINAIYCRSHAEPLVFLPHRDSRVHRELCLWFGGRAADAALQAGGLSVASSGNNRASSQSPSSTSAEADKEKVDVQGTVLSRSPAMLVSTTKGDIILVVSPVVSPRTYGDVISVCTHRGFVLQGIRRLQLSPERAVGLSMTTSQIAAFCPSEISSSPDSSARGELSAEPRVHCLVLLLRKENARHHIAALVKGLMDELTRQGLLGSGQSNLPAAAGLDPTNCFHAAPYTETLLQALGGNLSTVPDPCNIPLDLFCNRAYASDPEMEQVVMLTVVGMDAMKSAGELLHQILLPECSHESWSEEGPNSGFELLSLKWLPHLTPCQAREVTPFEVGDTSWRRSLDILMSSPVLVCALRRINAFTALANALKRLTPCRGKRSTSGSLLQTVMALTPEVTFRQAILFFTETDFVPDPEHCPSMKYLPPRGKRSQAEGGEHRSCSAESLLTHLTQGAQILCTVLLIKPGAWSHSLARILRKLELEKFTVVGMKHVNLEPDVASGLLSSEVKQDPAVLEAHCTYLTSGTALVLCLQRPNAVKKLIDLLGPEDPKLAQALDPSLWRAQYGISIVQNGFYGSKSYQIAVRDMKLFFPEGLCRAECQTLEEEEIHNLKRDPIVTLGINKKRKIIKRETGEQLSLLGSEQPCSFGKEIYRPLLDNLCQTTCLVLPGLILRGSEHPPYVELLDQLIGKGFTVTGARLTVLDAPQAHCISETLSRAKCSVAAKCSLLMDGLCLLLAVQRDNAVICFDSLLDSICWQKRSVLDAAQHLLYPQNANQAEELLCCLFDSLTSESIHRIEPQEL